MTGLDLVRLQLELAATGRLPMSQSDINPRGHAIECRINAEDESFVPSPGLINVFRYPGGPGVRMDTHIVPPYEVPHAYDSLIAKLVCSGTTRAEAISRMRRALHELDIKPIKTNIHLHRQIMQDETFVNGEYSTRFLEHLNN